MSDITISFLPLKGGPVENIKLPSTAGSIARTQALPHARVSISIDGSTVTGKTLLGGKPAIVKKAGSNLIIEIAGQSSVELLGFYATEGATLAGDGWTFSGNDGLAQGPAELTVTAQAHAAGLETLPPVAASESSMPLGLLGTTLAALTLAADTKPASATENAANNTPAGPQNQAAAAHNDALGSYSIAVTSDALPAIEYKVGVLPAPEQIQCFNGTAGDKVILDHTAFIELTDVVLQHLSLTDMFSAFDSHDNESPSQGANVHLLYDIATGILSYDPDGTNGPVAAWAIAEFQNHPDLSASDFVVI